MRLRYVTIHGYKRFAAPHTLYVGASLVAIVGPNEAGKTSLLDAMRHLSVEPPREEDPENPNEGKFRTREFSGRTFPKRDDDENPVIVSARFSLEPDDWKAIEGIKGVDKSIEFQVNKRADSGIRWQLYPRPKRDLRARGKVLGERRGAGLRRDRLHGALLDQGYV